MGLSWDLFSNEPGNLVYIVLEKPTCEKHLVPLFLSILVILPLKRGGERGSNCSPSKNIGDQNPHVHPRLQNGTGSVKGRSVVAWI